MDKKEKRSFAQMESSSADEYVYSANDHHNLKKMAAERRKFKSVPQNDDLDVNSKVAALNAYPYLVSLVSFTGEVILGEGCGTIIEAEDNQNIVITSLNLIRRPTEHVVAENSLADNLKIVVHSSDEKSYIGEILTYDFHYNLLIVKFNSKVLLPSAKLRMVDDGISPEKSFQPRPHALKVKVGDTVLVVGQYFYGTFDLMAASGRFSTERCDPSLYDCRELWSTTCGITICGDGSPLINLAGEVIGVTFFEFAAGAPFLPINLCYKWWDHYKKYKELRHPSYGFEASNLYAADLLILQRLRKRFPDISGGLVLDRVLPESNAQSAGLLQDDIIIKCDGKSITSFLQLWDIMWDKVGDTVEFEVFRADLPARLNVVMVVGEAIPNELNKWPRWPRIDYRPRRR